MSSVTFFSQNTWCMASLRSAFPINKASTFPSKPKLLPLQTLEACTQRLLVTRSTWLLCTCFVGYSQLLSINNGPRYFAMRHGRRVPLLNRPPDQHKALIRGLATQLLKHGRIKTTKTRASAIRKYIDKMVTLAKDGSLHKRRQALGFIYEKKIVHALFAEVPDRYGERNGGYTRVIRTLPRRRDNAPMAYIELV